MKMFTVKKISLSKVSLPKIAVLVTGLAAAILAVTLSPQAAHAFPTKAKDCAGCHTGATSAATTATPSTTSPVAGATYTVAITLAANPTGGNSGYAIVPVAPDTMKTNAGDTASLTSYTATMTAPAASGTYTYTVYTNMGPTGTGQTGSAVYSITVTGGSTPPPVTTAPVTTPPVTTPPVTTPPVTVPPVNVQRDIHGPYSLTADQCGVCHRAHTAKAPNLLVKGSQSTLCLSCHDGSAANANVQIQYELKRPANDPTTRDYYSHDAMAPSTHTRSELDEFGGVSNRHSECADCHNSHKARATPDSAQTADGWDASGRLAGVSGVSVANGAAGAAPTYTFLNGITNVITREYQLCFKCHSGSTVLPPPISGKPSTDYLDKAVEFNPANPSFHPVEAAGKNQTPKMAESLAGTSPYKLWNFTPTSTIRCLNCHASSSTPDASAIPAPAVDGVLAPHTSSNRGILLRNYKDRVLKETNAAYSAGDFALCYVCHAEAPFSSETSTATNFKLHGLHITELATSGDGGTDIDTPGAGQGNAICAECHFRLHSATNKVGTQTVPGSRLVNFAPNVTPNGGTLSWTPGSTGSGSCTLTCHGQKHSGFGYTP
ncbi:MAG: cytochrome c3 family protein [Actinomycetota bacterium]